MTATGKRKPASLGTTQPSSIVCTLGRECLRGVTLSCHCSDAAVGLVRAIVDNDRRRVVISLGGADVNARGWDGRTPLFWARRAHTDPGIAELLLGCGISPAASRASISAPRSRRMRRCASSPSDAATCSGVRRKGYELAPPPSMQRSLNSPQNTHSSSVCDTAGSILPTPLSSR